MISEDRVKQLIGLVPYARMLGVVPQLKDGVFTLTLPYKEDNIGNPLLPALHGGAIGGFMEIAAIVHLMISSNSETPPKTIGINVDYLRSGRPVDLYARGEITKLGSRVANVRVRAWQTDFDTPIATLHGNFLITEPE